MQHTTVTPAAEEAAATSDEAAASTGEAASSSSGAASAGSVYVVKSGDSLWEIAKSQLGDATRYAEIVELNGLSKGATLSIGQELKLP